ncbi:hypothetical protein SAMN04488033_10772 [Salegentibacter agarivorans]|uniref:Uncharacterized protein n=1 Tax=Salegentibacter agarivorans TaxID=345907 RepID=A0A1I2LB38_9FLAO|nr:hypothetical protein SAMN04488033_10772 [Salegentibacter agarivorans]
MNVIGSDVSQKPSMRRRHCERSEAIRCSLVTIVLGENLQQIATSTSGGLAMTVRIIKYFISNPPLVKNPTALSPV